MVNNFTRKIKRVRKYCSVGLNKAIAFSYKSTSRAWDKEKFWVPMRNRTSDLRICGVYYEVLMTSVPHTARIGNVDSVMRPRSPKSLCGSVVEHRSADPQVWVSIPHGDSEVFDEKTSFSILHRAFWTRGLTMFRWCLLTKISLSPCTINFITKF